MVIANEKTTESVFKRTYVIDIAVTSITIRIVRSIKSEEKCLKNVYTHLHGARKDHSYSGEKRDVIVKKKKKKDNPIYEQKGNKKLLVMNAREN